MHHKTYFFFGSIFLIAGIVIYLFFRQDTFISVYLSSFFAIEEREIKNKAIKLFIRNYGADFCWAVSFTFFVHAWLRFSQKELLYLIFCSFLGIIVEILQYWQIISGTADIIDCSIYLIGTVLAIFMIALILRKDGKKHEKKN